MKTIPLPWPLSVACAAALGLAAFSPARGQAPAGSEKLIFSDDFNGTRLDPNVWDAENGQKVFKYGLRHPDNAVVHDGVCDLVTKREGDQLNCGSIWVKSQLFTYGKFVARMRIGNRPGLNNAFWLATPYRTTDGDAAAKYHPRFEIDINEGYFPDHINMTVHNWDVTPHTSHYTWAKAGGDMSRDYHIYELLWTPQELTWKLDGRVLRDEPNEICHGPARLLFSSSIRDNIKPELVPPLEGTRMSIDWVKVYSYDSTDKQPAN